VAHFASARDVVAYANSLVDVARIEPRIVMREDRPVILIPGDEGFED
jgi:hypothetical protein